MIFDDNTAYQTYRIFVAIFGTLGMVVATSPMKKNYKRNLLFLGGYAIYTIVFTFFFMHFWGFLSFLRSVILTISLPGVIMIYMTADTSVSKHIFKCLSQLLLSLYLLISVTLLNTLFKGTLLSNAILLLSAYLAAIALEFFVLRRVFPDIAGINTQGFEILALIPIAFFLFVMTLALYPVHYTQNPAFPLLFYLSGAVIAIIYYAVFQYLRTQYQYQIDEQNREILKIQIQGIKKHVEDTKRNAKEVNLIWQDTHKMLSGIASLAKEGNAKAILELVSESTELNRQSTPTYYCSDPILNATLTAYLGQALDLGITIEHHLAIPENLPVDSAELSICFANALENATKACAELPENERKIIIRCIYKPAFMFEIANPYKGQITLGRNGLPTSTRTGHGTGTRSIIAFCEKHNAFYDFSTEGGWFKLVITL